jgi:MFS family permease
VASPRVVLTGAASAQAAVSLVAFGLPSIGPDLRVEYGLSLAALGAVLTANLLGSGVFLVPAGIVVDRYGSRRPLVAGTLLGSLGLVGSAFAPSTGVLLVTLFLSGIGSAIVPVAGFGALFRAYGPARRGFALGVRQMAVPLGGTIAAVVLPGLEALGGVRLALLSCAGAMLVLGLAFALVADESPPAGERPRVAVHRLVRAPGMLRLLLVAAFYIVVLQSVLAYTVPSVRDSGYSSLVAGATFFVLNVTAGVARIAWGRVADRHDGGRRARTLVEAGAVGALGAVLFTVALHVGTAAVIAAMVVLAFGALGWNALVYVSAGEKAPPEVAAQAVAIAAALIFVVSAVCTPPMGALAAGVGWTAFWLVLSGLAAAGAFLALGLRGQRRAVADQGMLYLGTGEPPQGETTTDAGAAGPRPAGVERRGVR